MQPPDGQLLKPLRKAAARLLKEGMMLLGNKAYTIRAGFNALPNNLDGGLSTDAIGAKVVTLTDHQGLP